jgi:hypothetical protein
MTADRRFTSAGSISQNMKPALMAGSSLALRGSVRAGVRTLYCITLLCRDRRVAPGGGTAHQKAQGYQ